MKSHLLLLAGAICFPFLASAEDEPVTPSVYTSGHADVGVEYTPGSTEFEAHWHLGASSVVNGAALPVEQEFAPDELVAGVLTTTSVSNGTVAAALNVTTGSPSYRTGSAAYPPNLGFGLEEVGNPEDWLNGTINLTLSGFSGPGALAISQTISGFGTFVWFSSFDANKTSGDNNWDFTVGGHQHLEWWFTQSGLYDVTFTWSGTYIGGETPVPVNGSGTYGFQVGVVPEPGTWALTAFGIIAVLIFQRRRILA